MREIKAYFRTQKVPKVIRALRRAGVPHMTVTHVRALGSGLDPKHFGVSWEAGTLTTDTAKLEFVCAEADVDALVMVLRARAWTGEAGDGIIFVSPVERAVKIRTGAEGSEALV